VQMHWCSSATFDGSVLGAASAPAQPKKQKGSRLLRQVQRELEEERARAQGTASAAQGKASTAQVGALQQETKQPEPSAEAVNGLHTRTQKPAKAKASQRASVAAADALQESATQQSTAPKSAAKQGKTKPKAAPAAVADTEAELGAEARAEQPSKKGAKQGKQVKQKSKKLKGPDPATGKLLEGAIAMLAARAPKKHVKR